MTRAVFLPVDGHLPFIFEKQSRRSANLECLRFGAAEAHFTWLFLTFDSSLVEDDACEVSRERDPWKFERTDNQVRALAQFELLPDHWIEGHIGSYSQNGHVPHETAVG